LSSLVVVVVVIDWQVLIKDGELNKLSRKEMQPRMFFLVSDHFSHFNPTLLAAYLFIMSNWKREK